MDNVSGQETVSGTGGDTLFSFDPVNAMSRKRRSKKLESMQCWPQVKHMLDNGIAVPEIVHYIQITRKEYTNVKPQSLTTIIYQWLGSLDNRKRLIDYRVPVKHLNLIKSNSERVDPIDGMNMLFALHMDRVLMAYDKEKQKKAPSKDNNKMIEIAMDMLNSLAQMQGVGDPKMMSLKNPTNSTTEQRVDGTLAQMDRIKKQFEERWGSTAAQVLLDPESRNKLFNAVNKIRKTAGPTMARIIEENSRKANEASTIEAQQTIEGIYDNEDGTTTIDASFESGN